MAARKLKSLAKRSLRALQVNVQSQPAKFIDELRDLRR